MRWAIFHICSLLTLGIVQPCNNNLSPLSSSLKLLNSQASLTPLTSDHVRVSVNCGAGAGGPLITEDIGNMTVALGREATLKCVVTGLSDYKVTGHNWPHLSTECNKL